MNKKFSFNAYLILNIIFKVKRTEIKIIWNHMAWNQNGTKITVELEPYHCNFKDHSKVYKTQTNPFKTETKLKSNQDQFY